MARLLQDLRRAGAVMASAFLLSGFAFADGGPKFAYVTNQNSETVSVVDLETFQVTATIAVPGKCAGVAVSPVAERVYVSCPDAHDVAVIDSKTNSVVARWPAGKGPLGIAVQPRTGRVFVADWYDKIVRVLDPTDGKFLAEIEVGQSPSGIDFSTNGTAVVADRDSNTVSVISSERFKRYATIPVGERPFGISVDSLFPDAFTANVGSDDVSVVEAERLGLAAAEHDGAGPPIKSGNIKVGRRPYAVALSRRRAFVTDQYGGTVSVIDRESQMRTDTIEACDHPEGINYDASRKVVYVACWFGNKMIRLDAESLKITGEVTVGDGPRAFGNFLK